jgi:hypothetical protein
MTYYKSNIFTFDYLIMPVWIPGSASWHLIVVSLKAKEVKLYDPVRSAPEYRPSMQILFRYLSKEYSSKMGSSFAFSEYSDISYNEVVTDRFE